MSLERRDGKTISQGVLAQARPHDDLKRTHDSSLEVVEVEEVLKDIPDSKHEEDSV
jgi:hypothetical protein